MNDTRTKILDVADDLVQRVGLNAMSYKHISEAIGIRKASIHHHFPKKGDLIDGMLERCETSYSDRYRQIVNGCGQAPEKLRKIAALFEEGLSNNKLCLVASINTDCNTLHESSSKLLQGTIENTLSIYSTVFEQGREEKSLTFTGTNAEAAFTFFSFLIGAQSLARSHGGVNSFHQATELFIEGFIV